MKFIKFCAFILCLLTVPVLSACGKNNTDISDGISEYIKDLYTADLYFIDDTNYISDSFQSHLPLIILEKSGTDNNASLTVIDSGALNSVNSDPASVSEIGLDVIRYENNEPRPKEDYFFRMDENQRLLGMDSGKRWFLLGGFYDKSLIRNYIGYKLAASALKNSPDVRFCELLFKDDNGYEYQGVYLLVENVSSEDDIVFRRTEHYWEGFEQTVVIENILGMFVLQDNWGGGSQTQIEAAGTAIEKVAEIFNSPDTNIFLQYSSIIDKESFHVYFLINELLSCYESMNESVYTYDPKTNKIYLGPVWNFELAFDNQKDSYIDVSIINYQRAPFISFMMRDGDFISELVGVSKDNLAFFNNININNLINTAAARLGTAYERDWYRWGEYYFSEEYALVPYTDAEENDGIVYDLNGLGFDDNESLHVRVIETPNIIENAPERSRQFDSYNQEIIKLKYYAGTRPSYVRKAITLLRYQDDLLGKVNAYGNNTLFAVLSFCVFTVSIYFARKTAGK